MKKLAATILTAAALASCATQEEQSKTLVLYYSQEGATKAVAEQIASEIGADIECFDVEEPYTGTYQETIERCLAEMESGKVIALAPLGIDLSEYDTIFLGYPIWFGTFARPVLSLLDAVDLSGKTIIPFCTFGSGGLQSSSAELAAKLPETQVLEGYGVRTARIDAMPAELERFLIFGGYKEGEVEEFPEYSEMQPVTKEEADVFCAACSSYQFPLGTPVSYGKRTTSTSVDYIFTSESEGMDGKPAQFTIYVTKGLAEDATPEFTMVVR